MRSIIISIIVSLLAFSLAYAHEDDEVVYLEDQQMVVLSALDKITTQLTTLNIRQDETIKFGTLEITLRTCRTNPPEETPESFAFLEITDIGHNKEKKKVFSGWMFASSPALSPLEHPVYDVWVKDCKTVKGPASMGMR